MSAWNPVWLNHDHVTVQGNTARVRHQHLDRSSDEDSSSSTTAIIPLRTECEEYFEFLGFRPETSRNLWSAWNGLTAFDKENFAPDTFSFSQDWLSDYAHNRCDTINDDWQEYLFATLGLKQQFVDAIMDERFADLRLTAPALQWVHRTQRDRNDYLKDRSRASYNPGNSYDSVPINTSASGYGDLFPIGDIPPGFTVLWRGSTPGACKQMWPSGVLHQGQFCLREMCPPPSAAGALTGDLSLRHLGSYWSTQLETAQHYAGYAHRRNTFDNLPISVCLVRLEIPNNILESAGALVLDHPSPEYKETVWISRRAAPTPATIRHVKHARIRIGDICKSVDQTFEKMQSPTMITDANILKVDINGVKTKARQFFLSQDGELSVAIEQTCSQRITYHNYRDPQRAISIMD